MDIWIKREYTLAKGVGKAPISEYLRCHTEQKMMDKITGEKVGSRNRIARTLLERILSAPAACHCASGSNFGFLKLARRWILIQGARLSSLDSQSHEACRGQNLLSSKSQIRSCLAGMAAMDQYTSVDGRIGSCVLEVNPWKWHLAASACLAVGGSAWRDCQRHVMIKREGSPASSPWVFNCTEISSSFSHNGMWTHTFLASHFLNYFLVQVIPVKGCRSP